MWTVVSINQPAACLLLLCDHLPHAAICGIPGPVYNRRCIYVSLCGGVVTATLVPDWTRVFLSSDDPFMADDH